MGMGGACSGYCARLISSGLENIRIVKREIPKSFFLLLSVFALKARISKMNVHRKGLKKMEMILLMINMAERIRPVFTGLDLH